MITRLFSRSALHEHADPAQRVLGVAQLEPDSDELKSLVIDDPASEVRLAAANRCADLPTLVRAFGSESDPRVRSALSAALGSALAEAADDAAVQALLHGVQLDDAIRGDVARRAQDPARRKFAIDAIRSDDALVEVALGAGQAETRLHAAERVQAHECLQKLADAAKNRDHGVYRVTRQRLEAIKQRNDQDAEADLVLAQLEALAAKPGPILSEVIDLNRRWQALDMSADAQRMARCETARRVVQERLEREQEEQRARSRSEARLVEWMAKLDAIAELPDSVSLGQWREELAQLLAEAHERADALVSERLQHAQQRIAAWEREAEAVIAAETLVLEAERLASGTYIDHGDLPERWEALDRSIRTPAFTRRFEAALTAVDQRRLAHVQVAQQEATALRQHIHSLLHAAELALSSGQLREARTGTDEIKKLRVGAGTLPKPTTQRIGRLQQQLVEMERWQSFGQHNARVQLCERAEALAGHAGEVRQLAEDVQNLRNEWKALDQQYAGVPKSLWERFDRACEKAYAPAARHFAEQATRRKESRKKREDFIALATEHATMLVSQEPRDWRGIERWLRDTDQQWREGDLGSIEPRVWKELDTRLKAGLAPLRSALGQARDQAKQERKKLIEQTRALVDKALERDTPAQVKAIQTQWQQQAKAMGLAQRDERVLWDEFRGACDAVFKARQDKRTQDDGAKGEVRQALERLCAELDALAAANDKTDQEVRRAMRTLQDQWKEKAGGSDPAFRALETRFRNARTALESGLTSRARSRESAVWQTLLDKDKLCEALERSVRDGEPPAADILERWNSLPGLTSAWESKMVARREAAERALSDAGASADYRSRIDQAIGARQEILLELEVLLGLDSPPEFQADRLALQVKQLRDRFKTAATVGPENAGERLLAWCVQPGIAEARDRGRIERVASAVGRRR